MTPDGAGKPWNNERNLYGLIPDCIFQELSMANIVAQKTYKIEFEVTVEMEQIGEQHLHSSDPLHHLVRLRRLQSELLRNEPALLRQMLAALLGKLQGYVDYLASQDDLASLKEVAASLPPADRSFFQEAGQDFASLTRPLRVSSMSARVERSAIEEKLSSRAEECCEEARPGWRQVWADLLRESEAGKLLGKFAPGAARRKSRPSQEGSHNLLVRHITRQLGAVRIEAACTCAEPLAGEGEDESQALEALWGKYRKHQESPTFQIRPPGGWQVSLRSWFFQN
jgi:hypothetical protein